VEKAEIGGEARPRARSARGWSVAPRRRRDPGEWTSRKWPSARVLTPLAPEATRQPAR
jgi:hypothetical protein